MSIYAIGDIQGCYKEFKKLLENIGFKKNEDTLWLTGDLVNRGPNSLDTIKFIMELDDSVITVLGNHDFNLMAVYYEIDPWIQIKHTFDDILSHKDCDLIIEWYRNQKIVHYEEEINTILVHAGFYPQWSLETTLNLGEKINKKINGDECKDLLSSLWTNTPSIWDENMTDQEKIIFAINVFTRMRYLNKDLSLNLEIKDYKKVDNDNIIPWFMTNSEVLKNKKCIIGHWSTLGYYQYKNLISIDTGCVWGNELTSIKILKDGSIHKASIKC
ncbi:MAG: symmetrical bis(5'-nucleosyl)-tetraphosphatase [Pseudomonadota bacterium]|nr:symmetrical bis(5'-nucleosyl)-tetraphosphatase [Pseudomonadota bacterium]|tara:strand:- start:1123 stop:1938 length:816 start_codon:yes stop_codon:yes gene_type:complete